MTTSRRSFLEATALSVLVPFGVRALGSEISCDVAVIGAGTGGFAAALAALRAGLKVVLTEETDWIGGQLTAQAVPPDEHPWIEQFGCTASYRKYREAVRDYYRQNYPLTEAARKRPFLSPGNGSVSRLTHEFRVSVAVLEAMLAPYVGSGQLVPLLRHVPDSAEVHGDKVRAVIVQDLVRRGKRTILAKYFVDATELGDLLPLTGTEFVTGAESQSQTGELHAPVNAQPANSQSFTFCFAMDYLAGEDHTIEKPDDYGRWRDYVPALLPAWPGRLFSWTTCTPRTLQPDQAELIPNVHGPEGPHLNLWTYRRLADTANFLPGSYRSDITLVNWPQNDYWLADLVTCPFEKREELLLPAKQLSLSFLYWMQTDAPGPSGRPGWKGLRLRPDITGTDDGMGKYPYIRESRRIKAEFTVLEKHVGTEMRAQETHVSTEEALPAHFADSVGIGSYRIDLHPSASGTNYIDISSLPFQIPLGALIPRRIENLLPASKNIGTTHITNGCYRLHPVEWNIGEAAGAVAAHALRVGEAPRAIRNTSKLLDEFQRSLISQGFELAWPHIHPV